MYQVSAEATYSIPNWDPAHIILWGDNHGYQIFHTSDGQVNWEVFMTKLIFTGWGPGQLAWFKTLHIYASIKIGNYGKNFHDMNYLFEIIINLGII